MADKDDQQRNQPLNIPLDFDAAVNGFLAVNPDEPDGPACKPPEKKRDGQSKKKPAKKK